MNKPEKLKGAEGRFTVKSRNEPRNTLQVLHVLSVLKEMPIEEVAEVVFENTERLFGKFVH